MKCLTVLSIYLLQAAWLQRSSHALSITSGNCRKNVSIKYQVPITRTRAPLPPLMPAYHTNELLNYAEQYVEYEERTRWDTVRICCEGYRSLLFGFCEPICTQPCPALSYCAAPDKCACLYGYTASHLTNKQQPLLCRPNCQGGCPEHSYCIAHNQCKCRSGYKDVSNWFYGVRCARLRCPPQRRLDVARGVCVPMVAAIEELMLQVANKLAQRDASEQELESEQESDVSASATDDISATEALLVYS